MNKEITIYELLGLIKDDKAPKKIKYKDTEYILSDGVQDYLECNKYDFDLLGYCFCNYRTRDFINDKVEIIEDNEDIKELEIKNGKVVGEWENGRSYAYTLSAPQTVMVHKINELVRKINAKEGLFNKIKELSSEEGEK